MAKTSVTSSDVAELANVSQSAVSRTFTEGASVSEETREKVLAAARTLGYRPNKLARSLISGRSHIVTGTWLSCPVIYERTGQAGRSDSGDFAVPD